MSASSHYIDMPKSWEHEESDRSVGIMADSMTHLDCTHREHSGVADITGGGSTSLQLTGGYERFTEEWTCRDCSRVQKFRLDAYTGWDEPDVAE